MKLSKEKSKLYTIYKKPTDQELRSNLTKLQYKVTQNEGTESPFQNEYWNLKEEGIFVDIVSGEPLFSSKDKYVSGTGWPSFTKTIHSELITYKEDYSFFLQKRIEVRSKYADSHLGHLFNDGPSPTFRRYCINSASLKFIPKSQLKEQNYVEYLALFKK